MQQEECLVNKKAEIRVLLPEARSRKDCQQTTRNQVRGRELPRSPQKKPALLTTRFGTSRLQSWETSGCQSHPGCDILSQPPWETNTDTTGRLDFPEENTQIHHCRDNQPYIVHTTLDLAFANNILCSDSWFHYVPDTPISLWWKISLLLEGVCGGPRMELFVQNLRGIHK